MTITRHKNTLWMILLFVGLVVLYWLNTPSSTILKLPKPIYATHALNGDNNTRGIKAVTFKDVTLAAGINQPHIQRSEHLSGLHESLGAGACAVDYDNDGWVDLLTLNGSGTTHFFGKPQWWQANSNSLSLYKNNRDGTFSDVTTASGLTTSTWTMGCAYADVDNDGDQDFFISHYGANQLWRNNGEGTFTNITKDAGISGTEWSTSVSFADINRDGLLDIYVNNFIDFTSNSLTFETASGYEASIPENFTPSLHNGQANQLWINQGGLRFEEKAQAFGIDNTQGRSLSSQWLDINNDDYPDLIVANDKDSANKVFLNNAGKNFTDISTSSGLGFVDKATSVTVMDVNNDQHMDLFLATDQRLYPKLYSLNQTTIDTTKNLFSDNSNAYQLPYSTAINQSHWGSVATDVNLDGWTDIVIANGMSTPNKNAHLIPRGQPNTLLLNQRGQGFIDHSALLAPETYSSSASRCVLSADFNNDGAPDLYISNNNGLGQLLSNTIDHHQWLGVDLKSTDGLLFSTTVTLQTGDKTISRRFGEQQHFLCAGDQRLLFGLGTLNNNAPHNNQKLTLTIDWSNGQQQLFENITPNHYHQFTQGQSESELIKITHAQALSSIGFSKAEDKLRTIQWLIDHNHLSLAEKELKHLWIDNDESIRLRTLLLSQTLPAAKRNAFIAIAINDPSTDIRLKAIDLIKHNEDELLSRWLLKQLTAKDADIACASAHAFAHFFDEEEAFLVYQYTSLSPLIRLATDAHQQKQLCGIFALGKSEHYRALQPLMTLLTATNKAIGLAATKALALLKEKASIPLLLKRFHDQDEAIAIRAAALIAIKQIDPYFSINTVVSEAFKQEGEVLGQVIDYAYFTANNNLVIRGDLDKFIQPERKIKRHTLVAKNKTPLSLLALSCEQIIDANLLSTETIGLCLDPTIFYKKTPNTIHHYLQKNETTRYALLPFIASRKERWAREVTLLTLQDENTPIDIKKAVLQQLPTTLPIGTLRELTALFTAAPTSDSAPYIARYIVSDDNKALTQQLLTQLDNRLMEGKQAQALLLAEALIDIVPQAVIDRLLRSTINIENPQ